MHTLIIGRTGSGKTTWAKKKARSLQKIPRPTIILDRWKKSDWIADENFAYVTDDRDKFLQAVWENENCSVFVDEAGSDIGKYDDIMNELATISRKYGHNCYFITQRCKQLSTTLRSQCGEIVIFKQALADTKDLSNEFVEPMINEAHTLEHGEFIYVRDGHKPLKLNVFKI